MGYITSNWLRSTRHQFPRQMSATATAASLIVRITPNLEFSHQECGRREKCSAPRTKRNRGWCELDRWHQAALKYDVQIISLVCAELLLHLITKTSCGWIQLVVCCKYLKTENCLETKILVRAPVCSSFGIQFWDELHRPFVLIHLVISVDKIQTWDNSKKWDKKQGWTKCWVQARLQKITRST